jgi:hypothetical protein
MIDYSSSFTMTLDEALSLSPEGCAYAWAPNVQGGFVYCGPSRKPHTGAAEWMGDPETLKWRPVGGEDSWSPLYNSEDDAAKP